MAMFSTPRNLQEPKIHSGNALVAKRPMVENFASDEHVICSTPLPQVKKMRKKMARDEAVNVSAGLPASSRSAEKARAPVLSLALLRQSETDGEARAREE
jgi:hypothetical protein